jgi:phosphatidylserine decarboxylase
MERVSLVLITALSGTVLLAAFLFWRYVWFFRNPPRSVPVGMNVVSPADGTVVYVKDMRPGDEVIVIKQGLAASVKDIVREDIDLPKLLIGVFMSPFDVHFNRAPLAGKIEAVKHYPCKTQNLYMGFMHLRTLLHLHPYYKDSRHIMENERTVTRIRGRAGEGEMSCYVVQIASRNVNGIDSYFPVGSEISKGQVFGMIRIGSQVDTVLTKFPGMRVKVRPGDKVRAGESVLVEW